MVFGYFIGISFPFVSLTKINLPSSLISTIDVAFGDDRHRHTSYSGRSFPENLGSGSIPVTPKIYVPTNPHGAESLPPGIVVAESDFYMRRLWGEPSEDLRRKPKYLVTFTVGLEQKNNIDAAVKKFSEDFQIMLFHYDGRTSEWDQFEWSRRAVHVSARKQTKWYIQLVRKHGLEISQPGLEPNNGLTWQMTKRRGDREVHKDTDEKPGWCSDPHLPPCAAFVEIMAPVFSREAWRCVWHMIQNDLVHGWGLDFALRRCVEPAHEKIGVVDSQWIIHQVIPSLGNQVGCLLTYFYWQFVRERCRTEWAMFQDRLTTADKQYFAKIGRSLH
nr:T6D22.12 isoform 1 [Ipomoea batatas]